MVMGLGLEMNGVDTGGGTYPDDTCKGVGEGGQREAKAGQETGQAYSRVSGLLV